MNFKGTVFFLTRKYGMSNYAFLCSNLHNLFITLSNVTSQRSVSFTLKVTNGLMPFPLPAWPCAVFSICSWINCTTSYVSTFDWNVKISSTARCDDKTREMTVFGFSWSSTHCVSRSWRSLQWIQCWSWRCECRLLLRGARRLSHTHNG